MVGNDIVDIAEAKRTSNWQRPRFLDKLFTTKEKALILNSADACTMVWRLWSMKEAAYKLYIQLNPNRFYAPKLFQCTVFGCHGKVKYKAFECLVTTKTTLHYVHSEAYLYDNNRLSACIQLKDNSYNTQSLSVKEALLTNIYKKLNLIKSELRIEKSDFGIPSVYCNTKKLDLSISISHHGHYGAYMVS
tara:strand:- start:65 stop:634 length:570 start_codon:yes stop_codon:yes gene_type:complete